MAEIENALFCGERIGDMSRERLLEVIEMQARAIEQTSADWKCTLDAWGLCIKAKAA